MAKNFGMRVQITFNKLCKFKNKTETLRNVTEIHYNYPSSLNKFIGKSIAFESNIHKTGITYQLADIDEFETELENKKEKEF
jgi:hypothetical protein